MTIKSDFDLGLCFQQLRLGLGEIRLTLSQQEEIVALIEQKLNKHDDKTVSDCDCNPETAKKNLCGECYRALYGNEI